jgi:tRNA U34 5-methylaminomethyl-2-thiouridine-forming methyltransferase MnmC
LSLDKYKIVLRELTWKEALIFDAMSFRKKTDEVYFSSEHEKKLILNSALVAIYLDDNEIENSLSNFDYNSVEKIWAEYQKYLHLTNSETNFIYQATKKYFSSDSVDAFPMHPFIIEVDYMLKGILSLSKTEFEKFTIKQFEALQLILSIKNST